MFQASKYRQKDLNRQTLTQIVVSKAFRLPLYANFCYNSVIHERLAPSVDNDSNPLATRDYQKRMNIFRQISTHTRQYSILV